MNKTNDIWLDNKNRHIQAHGYSIFYDKNKDTYYWYGENKEFTLGGECKIWHFGVRCYSSKDLNSWKDEGIIIPPNLTNKNHPLHPSQCMDRPHIIYCPKTKKYVCWIKIIDENISQFMVILTADEFLGPYKMINKMYFPVGMCAGDFDLIEDDKKAYIIFERPHDALVCATLNKTYKKTTSEYSIHLTGKKPPFTREAPAYVKYKGKHYLFTSGTTGYFPNKTIVYTFDSFHGEYKEVGNPFLNDKNDTSNNSQISSILKTKDGKYFALADRWLLSEVSKEEVIEKEKEFTNFFKDKNFKNTNMKKYKLTKKNISYPLNSSQSTYVWFEINFSDKKPRLEKFK